MRKADIMAAIGKLDNQAAKVLTWAYQQHRRDSDWRIYESIKHDLQTACRGDVALYEQAINILTEILEL